MQKTAVAQVLLTIFGSKNKWEKNSRKWESGQKKWENSQYLLIHDASCAVALEAGLIRGWTAGLTRVDLAILSVWARFKVQA